MECRWSADGVQSECHLQQRSDRHGRRHQRHRPFDGHANGAQQRVEGKPLVSGGLLAVAEALERGGVDAAEQLHHKPHHFGQVS